MTTIVTELFAGVRFLCEIMKDIFQSLNHVFLFIIIKTRNCSVIITMVLEAIAKIVDDHKIKLVSFNQIPWDDRNLNLFRGHFF